MDRWKFRIQKFYIVEEKVAMRTTLAMASSAPFVAAYRLLGYDRETDSTWIYEDEELGNICCGLSMKRPEV